jgi:hypothetical protein
MERLATEYGQELVGNRLNSLIRSTIPGVNFPIISRGESWVRVNDIVIDEHNDGFRVKRKGHILAFFQKKSWAVAYAVAYCQGEYVNCSKLIQLNFRLAKYTEEIVRYNYQLDIAIDTYNLTKEKIISDRLSRTIDEYDAIVHEAEQIIKSFAVR